MNTGQGLIITSDAEFVTHIVRRVELGSAVDQGLAGGMSDFCREHGASVANLEKVIEQSDVITMHVPLTKLTRHMVDQDFLERMKQTAFLINTSRGDVVDQEALKNSLTCGSIAGAAIDVFAMEPPSDMELLSLPQLMVTPHIGGNAIEAVESMGRSAISHLVTFFNKHPSV